MCVDLSDNRILCSNEPIFEHNLNKFNTMYHVIIIIFKHIYVTYTALWAPKLAIYAKRTKHFNNTRTMQDIYLFIQCKIIRIYVPRSIEILGSSSVEERCTDIAHFHVSILPKTSLHYYYHEIPSSDPLKYLSLIANVVDLIAVY